MAGAASFTYETGPDGNRYAIGGEVPISAPKGATPQDDIRIAQTIRAAALAPSDPSGQDLAVAANATAMESRARAEAATAKAQSGSTTTTPGTGKAQSGGATAQPGMPKSASSSTAVQPGMPKSMPSGTTAQPRMATIKSSGAPRANVSVFA
jgi:hypothetical protein